MNEIKIDVKAGTRVTGYAAACVENKWLNDENLAKVRGQLVKQFERDLGPVEIKELTFGMDDLGNGTSAVYAVRLEKLDGSTDG